MRLIDADELREQCHTIPDPKGIYCGLDIIEKYEIDDAPTVCDIEQMIIEIAQIDDRNGWIPIDEVFDIILKYQKGSKE